MKNKIFNIILPIFLFCDIVLFGFLIIQSLHSGAHIYWSDSYKTVSSSNGEVVLDIYDETVYTHYEPDDCLYTVKRNGKTYMSFRSEKYDVEIKNDSVILEYEHNHNLRFKVH